MRDALHAFAFLHPAHVGGFLLVACIMHVCAGSGLVEPARGQDTTIELSTATIADLNAAFEAGTLDAEQLVTHSLDRIEAYDQAGPQLNAVLTVNPRAVERARMLDAERAADGPRSPLHGVPVVLKDNVDTADMPTTASSFMLAGSLPPDDAFLVQTLRDAGAIILAKLNMSEFASGGPISSLGGPIRNPHDPERTPAGSSGEPERPSPRPTRRWALGRIRADRCGPRLRPTGSSVSSPPMGC
jgi:amidase